MNSPNKDLSKGISFSMYNSETEELVTKSYIPDPHSPANSCLQLRFTHSLNIPKKMYDELRGQ